ncbi:MAG: hypothetical protein L6264_07390 [Weeksellaceae bacterium]|nr:hypothetical protein [Bacteroidota bacterium]MCG2780757.1 hypothetical protein [Weeksellaceae bacterium]
MESPEDFFHKFYTNGAGRCRCVTFHLDLVINQEIKTVCNPQDWRENGFFFFLLPKVFREDLRQMLIVGFTIKEAYDLLKETYNF